MNLKKIIKEELGDEWSWTQEEPNIWRSYQMLLFDEVPTKEDVKKFIMDAFNSGLVCQEGIDAWMKGGIDRDVRGIVKDAEINLKPYLRLNLDDEWFYMGIEYDDILDRYTDLRPIKYSEAKNYLMTESEDDWGWVMGETLSSLSDYVYEYKIEDLNELIGVKVKLSPESEYYKQQLTYVDDYPSGDIDNPIDVIGVIEYTSGLQRGDNLPLYVKWANDSKNNYNTWDLDIVL